MLPFLKMNTMMIVLTILILVGCNGSPVRDMTFDSLESETGQKVLIPSNQKSEQQAQKIYNDPHTTSALHPDESKLH